MLSALRRYRVLVLAVLMLALVVAGVLLFLSRSSGSSGRSGHDQRSSLSLSIEGDQLTVKANGDDPALKALSGRRLRAVCGNGGPASVAGSATWPLGATSVTIPLPGARDVAVTRCLLERPGGLILASVAIG